MPNFDPASFTIMIVVILLSLSIHEFAHAKFADMAGDPTPRLMGRVTLNPLAHLDPIGTIMIVLSSMSGFGIGWGEPVLVDPRKMKNPRWDHFASVAAGPVSNLLQAALYGLAFRLLVGGVHNAENAGLVGLFLFAGVIINVSLALFNLVPIGPLDGHWLVGAFLPEPQRLQWYRFNRGIGGFIFIALVLMPPGPFDILGRVLRPAVMTLVRLFLGA